MTWSDFYLICFAVGFCFSFFSFVFGDRASESCTCRISTVMRICQRYTARPPFQEETVVLRQRTAEMPRMFIMAQRYRHSILRRWPRSWPGLGARDIC
jgi:hypothetical protein